MTRLSPLSPLSLLSLLCAFASSLPAQTDPSGDWHTWKTDHFRVYARTQDSSIARRAAAEAERSYALLASELVPPGGPIELLLNDNVDFSNGFTDVTPVKRISLYLAAPAVDAELGQYDSWLRVVITHELTHVFHLDRARGIWTVGRAIFGRNSWFFPNSYEPAWVTEGLAVYYESRFSNAGRERGGYHGQLLAARDLDGSWPDANDGVFSSVRWPSGEGRYAFGSRFLALEAATHGDSVIPKFVENTSGQLFAGLVSNPLENAGGEGVPEGWRRLAAAARPRGDTDRVVVRALRTEPRLAIAPNGERVAYVQADGRSVSRVAVLDRAGRTIDSHIVNGAVDLAWLGDTVLVTQLEFDTPVRELSDLYRWIPGGDWSRVTRGARVATPFAWRGTPGAVRTEHGARAPALVRHESLVSLTVPEATEWARIAASPDGRWAAGACLKNGHWDIALWPVDDPSGVRMITDDQAVDAEPSWSGDGAWLLFASERAGLGQIYAYNVANQSLVRLTDAATGAREPVIDAAGTLWYTTQREDGFAIALRDSAFAHALAAESASPPPAFVPAPAVSMTESSYAEWWALKPRYWRPIDDAGGLATGHFWGVETSASDALDRIDYVADLYASPTSGRWEAYLGADLRRWRSIAVDASVEQVWERGTVFLRPNNGFDTTASYRERFASAGVTWRTRNWRSALAVRIGTDFTNERLLGDEQGSVFSNRNFVGGTVSLSMSRVQGNALSMSLEDGAVFGASYRRLYEINGTAVRDQLTGSLNWYVGLPLPGFSHWTLAGRTAGAWSGNSAPAFFGVGGESGDVYQVISGLTIGGGRRNYPLRGYPPSGGVYTEVVVSAVELRIPLLLVGRGLGRLPVALDRVGLSLFGEGGGGRDATTNPASGAAGAAGPDWATQFADIGAELVLDINGGLFDGRLRAGVGVPLRDGLGISSGRARSYLTFGTSF